MFSKDINRLYNENTTLAVEIHKIHKFLNSDTKKVEVRFQLIKSKIDEITRKMQNLSAINYHKNKKLAYFSRISFPYMPVILHEFRSLYIRTSRMISTL